MAVSRVKTSSILQGFPKSRSLLAGNAAYDPAATFLIQRVAGTGSNTSITFSSIPQTYKHLQVRILSRNTSAATDASLAEFNCNGDTTVGNYAWHELYGNGTSTIASGTTGALPRYGYNVRNGATANIMGVTILDILDYSSTSKNKTFRSFTGNDRNGAGIVSFNSGLYINTSAISSLTFYANNTLTTTTYFTTNTTFALYGMVG